MLKFAVLWLWSVLKVLKIKTDLVYFRILKAP